MVQPLALHFSTLLQRFGGVYILGFFFLELLYCVFDPAFEGLVPQACRHSLRLLGLKADSQPGWAGPGGEHFH